MEDRWPYPVSQTMQRQTGRGHKPARPAPADTAPEPDAPEAKAKPAVRGADQAPSETNSAS